MIFYSAAAPNDRPSRKQGSEKASRSNSAPGAKLGILICISTYVLASKTVLMVDLSSEFDQPRHFTTIKKITA